MSTHIDYKDSVFCSLRWCTEVSRMQILRPLVCRVLETDTPILPKTTTATTTKHADKTLLASCWILSSCQPQRVTSGQQKKRRRKKSKSVFSVFSYFFYFFILFRFCFKLQCTSELKGVNKFTIHVTVWFFLIVINGTSFMASLSPPPPPPPPPNNYI